MVVESTFESRVLLAPSVGQNLVRERAQGRRPIHHLTVQLSRAKQQQQKLPFCCIFTNSECPGSCPSFDELASQRSESRDRTDKQEVRINYSQTHGICGVIDGNYEWSSREIWFLDALRCCMLDFEAREGLGSCGMARRTLHSLPDCF